MVRLDGQGAARSGGVEPHRQGPASKLEAHARELRNDLGLEAHARELRNDLGLSPLALAKLLSVLDSAPAGTDDAGLDGLKAEGGRIIAARTAALEAEVSQAEPPAEPDLTADPNDEA